jgi:hypothetical protein
MNIGHVLRVALVGWVAALVPVCGWAEGCEGCHGDQALYVKNRKLYDYYQDWLTSPHKEAGVTCSQCHGGNPDASDRAAAHQGLPRVSDPSSTVFYKNQAQTCGRCHPAVAEQFTRSRHHAAVSGKETAPTCSTCHRAMNKKPYYRDIVRSACQHCHNEASGVLRPEVVDRADEVLHRVNISRGYLGWTIKHYEREGWPGESARVVDGLRRTYHDVLAKTHSFELLAADDESAALLAELKEVFKTETGSSREGPPRAR